VFSVLFEVHPKSEQWDNYLGYARMLRPELETVDGFFDNIRYRSLTRGGWILSLSGWRDEKSVVRSSNTSHATRPGAWGFNFNHLATSSGRVPFTHSGGCFPSTRIIVVASPTSVSSSRCSCKA
jgi:hypothetical protein